jgi:O-antigen/teichoic acid export membrane protein
MTRRAADRLLRLVMLSTLIGVVVIVVLAIVISDQRGLLLLVGAFYLVTSLAAYFTLRRSLAREVARRERQQVEEG